MRRWPWLLIAAAVVVVVVSSRPLLGSADWAGLGQWVGGVGAFAAVVAALWLAGAESRHERAREAERSRIQAYYVKADWETGREQGQLPPISVRHAGAEPMVNVRVVAVHTNRPPSRPPLKVVANTDCPVLLPGEPWHVEWRLARVDLGDAIVALYCASTSKIEIAYEDLAGGRWKRIGSAPPEPDLSPR
ncbi:hypothetical protein [Amycolatopsis dendrobii]|uniref:Uncharacterized protein n=1 Tax=Amycolatopsis dendrobii TaxID=2760662 RepID=A0A7W3VVG2_9PSEU|nr:hypothetical protein [Amycolatopsis dendrobii]MBB1153951.1 hypothetical protein [Amycolatopsis dendrobii]